MRSEVWLCFVLNIFNSGIVGFLIYFVVVCFGRKYIVGIDIFFSC